VVMITSLGGGRYEVVRAIGAGGMGCVYLARDSVLSREVALKVLDERHAEIEEFVERFRREAQAAASLSHPNIVAVYDYGEDERGAPYIAMEHVAGGTLKERIREKGKLPPRVAAGVALQITSALEAAHESGIVHRDVKPENVLVTEDGNVKVADFGIARAAEATAVTATSTVLGSVRYLSPEQASGGEVGPASDLYSLGVVLYELLSGEVPFEAHNPIATAMRHLTETPAPPGEFEPRIPAALEAVTLKLLEKDPADRYPSAGALAEDLMRVLAEAAPTAFAPTERIIRARWLPERPPRSRRKRRILAALAVIPMVAVLVVLASSVGLGEESSFAWLIGKRAQEPLLKVEAPAAVVGGEQGKRVALAAPEPPERASAPEEGGQEEPIPADEKASEPEPQQLTVQPIVHKGATSPAPRPTQRPAQRQESAIIAVPDLTRMSVVEAEVVLAEVGLILRIASYVRSEDVPEGVILYQDAPPGYETYPGATVAVTVGEKVASKEVPTRDLEAERERGREKSPPEKRDRHPGKDDRHGAKGEHPSTEKGPPHEKQRGASSEGAKDHGKGGGGKGDGGKEDRGGRGVRQGR
jgi:eukaryotic-like serine/threonine-protein kinase